MYRSPAKGTFAVGVHPDAPSALQPTSPNMTFTRSIGCLGRIVRTERDRVAQNRPVHCRRILASCVPGRYFTAPPPFRQLGVTLLSAGDPLPKQEFSILRLLQETDKLHTLVMLSKQRKPPVGLLSISYAANSLPTPVWHTHEPFILLVRVGRSNSVLILPVGLLV